MFNSYRYRPILEHQSFLLILLLYLYYIIYIIIIYIVINIIILLNRLTDRTIQFLVEKYIYIFF